MKNNLITLLVLDFPQLQFFQTNLSLLFLLSKSITSSEFYLECYLALVHAPHQVLLLAWDKCWTIPGPLHLWETKHKITLNQASPLAGSLSELGSAYLHTCWKQTHTRLPPLLRGLYFILSYWSSWSISLGHRSFGSMLCSLLKAL